MPDITDAKRSDLTRCGLFGATAYTTDKKLVGYGVGLGTQEYTHDDDKEARNLVILGINSTDSNNALILGKGSIKIATRDAVQTKDKLKTNCTIPDKKFVFLCIIMLLMTIVKVFCLLTIFNSTILKQIKVKLWQEN